MKIKIYTTGDRDDPGYSHCKEIPKAGTKAWQKEMIRALKHPTFKVTVDKDPKHNVEKHSIDDPMPHWLKLIHAAQVFLKNTVKE